MDTNKLKSPTIEIDIDIYDSLPLQTKTLKKNILKCIKFGIALILTGVFLLNLYMIGYFDSFSNNTTLNHQNVESDFYKNNKIEANLKKKNIILPKLEFSKDFGNKLKVRQSLYPNITNPIDSQQVFGSKGAVAADEKRCSVIGLNVLKDGGSAVDAGIATGICLGLLNGYASGIGGGGFMLVRLPDGKSELIDFREQAPEKATELMYKNNMTQATVGGLAIGVPGELRGYELAHKIHGRLPWKRLIEPTIRLARDGFAIGKMLAYNLKRYDYIVNSTVGFKDVFLNPDGSVKKEGDMAKRINFANTLQRVADEGANAFYASDLSEIMASWIQKTGGIITAQDFCNYTPKIRKAAVFDYHGRKIITGSPPTSGTIVGFTFNIIEGYDFKDKAKKPTNIHRFVEALKFAFSQRTRIADPDFSNVTETFENQLSKSFAEATRKNITDDTTHPFEYYNPEYDLEDNGTTHVSVIDKDGMAVSLTSTINLTFGSKVMDPSTGVIFNNEMDDFSTPGASGGSKIITSTAQVLLNVLEFGKNLKEAIDDSRLHHQLLPNVLSVEPNYSKEMRDIFVAKGHEVKEMSFGESVVQGIRIIENGIIHAVSDGRKYGVPAAY
ncbi:hypothetical protein BB561_006962 [Smittium simulii]|uniref:Glutathione hydrolase n=1 Tax=Smittium simulii TaxID=133385 RepID=A0A2T9XZ40_9FUNG|nr:hypothetical protein BB561_006962 [Smittium simulii]